MEHAHILVVDDDIAVCGLLRMAFELEGISVDEAHHAVEADRRLAERVPDAVVLDLGLPQIDGLFYCACLRENKATRDIPIIAVSGSGSAGASALAAGATAFMHKPFDPLELLTQLERLIGVPPLGHAFGPHVPGETATEQRAELGTLIEIGRRRHERLDSSYRQTLAAIAASLERRGLEPTDHAERVTAYAMRLTVEVAPALSDDTGLEWGYLFHDIGMIGVPDEILLKRGSLRADEWRLLHRHTAIGQQLLTDVALLQGEGLRVVRSHHERWGGGGYPDGLVGSDIPLGARIFAVADALESMTQRRPYRRPLRWEAAHARIRKGAGGQFDPDVVDGLVACEADLVEIRNRFAGDGTGARPGPARGSAPGSQIAPAGD